MKYRHRVLTLLFFLSLITFIDRVCISVAGPQMQAEMGLTPARWGWVVGTFAIAYAAFGIPTGMLGDRIGPRRLLSRTVIVWSAFTALTGAVTNYFALLGARFAFGVGESGAFPNASASIARWFPARERARAQSLIWVATRLGAAISPMIVIAIQSRYGWRATFWILGAVGLVWVAIWHAWYRDDPREQRGVTEQELVEIGAVKAGPRSRPSLPWKIALRDPNLRHIMAMYFCFSYAAYFFISWLHTFLVKGRNFSAHELALFSGLPFLCGAAANLVGGFVSDYLASRWGLKWGRRCIGIAGLSASSLFVLGAFLSHAKIPVIVFLTLAYASADFMLPSAWAVCLDVGRKYAGSVTGAMNTGGQFGSFVSSVVFGYVVAGFHSYDAPLITIAVALLVSASQWFFIDPSRELVPDTEMESLRSPVGAERGD
jgi:MFS family permease